MAREFKDYDALAGGKEPIRFRIAGEDHELPPEVPAKLIMDVRRRAATDMTEAEAEDFGFQVAEGLIGKERFERIVSKVGIDTLGALVEDIMREYGFGGEGDPKAEADPAEAPSPSMTSSPTTEPSTQISNVFGLYSVDDTSAAS